MIFCQTTRKKSYKKVTKKLQLFFAQNQAMATVGFKVFKHHKKADGTYNIKIRVSHKGGNHYIDTPHYVIAKQLTAKLKVKDPLIVDILNDTLKKYRKMISELEDKLDLHNSETLRDFLIGKDADVNFLKFSFEYIDQLFEEK